MTSSILLQMGIDVWTLRSESEPISAVSMDYSRQLEARPELQGPISEPEPELESESEPNSKQKLEADSVSNISPRPASAQSIPTDSPSVGVASLDLIRQQLGKGDKNSHPRRHTSEQARPIGTADIGAEAAGTNSADATSSKQVDEFLFLFIDYADHSLVVSLPYGSAGLPDDYRFFIDDIDRALAGPNGAKQFDIQIRPMTWPMLKAAHIQHSMEDAQALVLQKVKSCRNLIVVFGDLPQKYLSAIRPKIKDKQLIYAADIEQHFKVPGLKKQLWEQLKPMVAYLNARKKQ